MPSGGSGCGRGGGEPGEKPGSGVTTTRFGYCSYPAGVISDRLPRAWVLATGWAVFAVVYAGFAMTNSSGAVWPLFLVYGGYIALTDGVSKALVADIVPDAVRSSAIASLAGLAALFASIMAGLLWDYVSISAPFLLGGICAIVAAVALVVVTLGGMFSEKRPATVVV
jgi:MFS family permease